MIGDLSTDTQTLVVIIVVGSLLAFLAWPFAVLAIRVLDWLFEMVRG